MAAFVDEPARLVGVDGQPLEAEADPEARDRAAARAAFARHRAWLGRELLTWLLFRSRSGTPVTAYDGEDVVVLFVGPVVLQGVAGDAVELRAKGHQAAYAEVVREALARGMLVHAARLRLQEGDRVYEVTLDAEQLAVRSAKLPEVLSEEEDDRLAERLFLVDRLAGLVDALWSAFSEVRSAPEWAAREVPAIRAWLEGRGEPEDERAV